jgi:hypothetical protein
MLSVTKKPFMLSVVMLSVVRLNVMAPRFLLTIFFCLFKTNKLLDNNHIQKSLKVSPGGLVLIAAVVRCNFTSS